MTTEKILITGGAGFIGSNLAYRLLAQGHQVTIYDDLSRVGCETNLEWLRQTRGEGFTLVQASVTDFETLKQAARGAERIYHLAGQVAVTTSVQNPRMDFEHNAIGTFNALEAARLVGKDPIFIYASTNKVYGGMSNVWVSEEDDCYHYADHPWGISENQPLDFHSPYGCSKGMGDQYTRDYARIYGLRSVVMRQSCIYGYRQFGVEDQGWVAWFIIAALKQRPITIYGNGKQVRDILFVDDLIDAYEAAVNRIDQVAGQIFNIGGGPENTMSIWKQFSPILEELTGRKIAIQYRDWRPGDQPIYVSDIRKARKELGWEPKTGIREGIRRLYQWVRDNLNLFNPR